MMAGCTGMVVVLSALPGPVGPAQAAETHRIDAKAMNPLTRIGSRIAAISR
jgi:hypothetical protein